MSTPPTHTHLYVGAYPFFTFTDQSIGDTIDASIDMQLGCITGDDLLLHGEEFERLEFHSTSDDEDFVIVDCRAPQRSLSEPVSSSANTVVPENSRTLSEIAWPREGSPIMDTSTLDELSSL